MFLRLYVLNSEVVFCKDSIETYFYVLWILCTDCLYFFVSGKFHCINDHVADTRKIGRKYILAHIYGDKFQSVRWKKVWFWGKFPNIVIAPGIKLFYYPWLSKHQQMADLCEKTRNWIIVAPNNLVSLIKKIFRRSSRHRLWNHNLQKRVSQVFILSCTMVCSRQEEAVTFRPMT